MTALLLSFVVGILSSAAFTGLVLLRRRLQFRLSFRGVLKLIEALAETISRDGYQFDHIVTIGRNSGVAGSVLAGQFGLLATVSISTVKDRRADGGRTIALDPISAHVIQGVGGKRVLVFICCNDSGASLEFVVRTLQELPDPPAEIRTACLYTAPSPSFLPRYSAVVLERDSRRSMTRVLTGLPWVTDRWRHPFAGERRT